MSYEQFGDDAAALLHAVGVERADVMGYSQGGGVALQLALRHPHLVSKLVTLSATCRQDGWYHAVLQALASMTANDLRDTPIGDAFRQHTDDPVAFATYVDKMRVLNFEDQHLTDDEMRGICARTMVIVGDADGVRPEHAVEMFNLRGGGDEVAAATGEIDGIPAARLVILPAASHIFGVPRRRRPGAGSHPVALREQNGAGREYSNMSASGRNRADRAMRAIVGRIRRLPKRRSALLGRLVDGGVLRRDMRCSTRLGSNRIAFGGALHYVSRNVHRQRHSHGSPFRREADARVQQHPR